MQKCLILLLCLLATGCTVIFPQQQESKAPPLTEEEIREPIVIRAFAARRFLKSADYERYTLDQFSLWRECGTIVNRSRGAQAQVPSREGDEQLPKNPLLRPVQRRVDRLSNEEKVGLQRLARKLLAAKQSGASVPKPGSLAQLTEPGIIELEVSVAGKTEKIATNVDALAEADGGVLLPARQFFHSLRKLGPKLCGTESFYGM